MEALQQDHNLPALLLQQHHQQQEQQQQQQADVVAILLQQPAISSDQAIVCKLLATSKALASLVAEHCSGRVAARYEAAAYDQQQHACFMRWLQRHACLVQQWHWRCPGSAGIQQLAMEEALAVALQDTAAAAAAAAACAASSPAVAVAGIAEASAAASAAALPKLHSYVCYSAGPAAHSILAALPASCLTHLELHFTYQGANVDLSVHSSSGGSSSGGSSSSSAPYSAFAAALVGLSSLRTINLQTKWFPVDYLLMSSSTSGSCCLSGCSQLKQLSLGRLWDVQCLQQLPTQLQHLQLLLHERDDAAQPLQLGQLTGLTHLSLQGNFAGFAWQDELPAGLRALHVASSARCLQPLLSLTQLTQLCVSASRTPAAQLQHLAERLTALQQIKLGYKSAAAAHAAAAAWPALPLISLDINTHFGLAAATFEVIGQLTRLTGLSIRSMPLNPHKVTPSKLAGQLRQLTALQELQVVRFDFQKQQQASQQDLQELKQRQQLYQQLNVHLRQLHLQRQQQQQQQFQGNQDNNQQELQEEQQHEQQHNQHTQQYPVGGAAANAPVSSLAEATDTPGGASSPDASAFVIQEDMLELVHAIACLPSLRSLELTRMRLGNAAAQLTAATQLTHVRLEDCGVLDPAARRVVYGLNTVG